jgi:hypothetical protein
VVQILVVWGVKISDINCVLRFEEMWGFEAVEFRVRG